MRILSLLPSATEIVYALGLGDRLVGVTHECVFPPEARAKPVVTVPRFASEALDSRSIDEAVRQARPGWSVYEIREDLLRALQPDLILTQDLCDVCAVSYDEVRRAARVLNSAATIVSLEPRTLDEMLETIRLVGDLTGRQRAAADLVARLRERIEGVAGHAQRLGQRPGVACVEWFDPPYVAGHWVPEMVELAGGIDLLNRPGQPSRRVPWDEVATAAPEVLVLLPCGLSLERARAELPALRAQVGWAALPAVRDGRVYLVHGPAYFNGAGPRLVDGLEILAHLLHPEAFPAPSLVDAFLRVV